MSWKTLDDWWVISSFLYHFRALIGEGVKRPSRDNRCSEKVQKDESTTQVRHVDHELISLLERFFPTHCLQSVSLNFEEKMSSERAKNVIYFFLIKPCLYEQQVHGSTKHRKFWPGSQEPRINRPAPKLVFTSKENICALCVWRRIETYLRHIPIISFSVHTNHSPHRPLVDWLSREGPLMVTQMTTG